MRLNSLDPVTIKTRVAETSGASRERLLVVVSDDADCLSSSLLRAMEHEFPHLRVRRFPSLSDVWQEPSPRIALFLVDMSLFDELRECGPRLLAHHPDAGIALLQLGERSAVSVKAVVASSIVRSILPMNLKLDVWLAAVRLILLGGEYYPFALLRSATASQDCGALPMTDIAGEPPHSGPSPAGRDAFHSLTGREVQILELVARGLQNKLIASELQLSEHTVKIHLHNIIGKLGVHNRTEAASLFLSRSGGFAGPSRRNGPILRPSIA